MPLDAARDQFGVLFSLAQRGRHLAVEAISPFLNGTHIPALRPGIQRRSDDELLVAIIAGFGNKPIERVAKWLGLRPATWIAAFARLPWWPKIILIHNSVLSSVF